MKPNKKNKFIKTIFLLLFIIYMTIYFSQISGYYEYRNYLHASLTKDQILKFEDDIKNGKNVKLTDYVVNTNKNYQTNLSKFGNNLSNVICKLINKGINSSFEFLNKLVDE